MFDNIITLTDSYKVSHYKQYPPGTTKVYSYFEARGGKFPETVFFGLQYLLKRYLEGVVVTPSKIAKAEGLCGAHFGTQDLFNLKGWDHIRNDHGGKLPLRIRAVPEGTVVPTGNVLMTVENTCPKCYWLTNYLETLLVQVWYPLTVATQSRAIKKLIRGYREMTGSTDGLDFGLHDFGFRGVSSVESAAIGGAAHLVNFFGTDTLVALEMLLKYYDARPVAGYSIPAAEHSTITSWGRENEVHALRNMIDQYPTRAVAVVSDSYDIFNACENLWGDALRERVLNRDGVLVIRPDSGDPVSTVLAVLDILGRKFGNVVNDKGYRVLNPKVRVIQGDGVNYDSINEILGEMSIHGWAAENVAFGMGGALLQKLDRDMESCAFKCSYIEGGEAEVSVYPGRQKWSRDVYKDPVGDPGKKSKRGKLALAPQLDGSFRTVQAFGVQHVFNEDERDALVDVFLNGELLVNHDFMQVRERAA